MWSLPWREALAKRSPDHGTHGINSEFLLPIRKKVAEGRMRVRAWPGAWFMSKTNTVFIVKPVYDKWKDEPEYQALLKKANLVQP